MPGEQKKPVAATNHSAVTRAGASIGTIEATMIARDLVLEGNKVSPTPIRLAQPDELGSLRADLLALRTRLADQWLKKARRFEGVVEPIVAILRASSMSTSKTRFDDRASMRGVIESLEALTKAGRPIPLALLLGGGKAPNVLKTAEVTGPDLAEWLSMVILSAIPAAIESVYAPGARVIAIPDAGLHTGDLGFPFDEVISHVERLNADLAWLGIGDQVVIPDTTKYLPTGWSGAVRDESKRVADRLRFDPPYSRDVREQVESLAFSLNTRYALWDYEHTVLVYAAASGHLRGIPSAARRDAAELYRRAESAGPHYVAVNHAIRQLDLASHLVESLTGSPDHVRMTVHAKPGEPRPLLAVPNHLARMDLLPMHGLGLRVPGEDGARYAITFDIEARICRYRAVLSAEERRFLFYEEVSEAERDELRTEPEYFFA